VPEAIQPLRHADLEQDQVSVWNEWESSGDQALWEVAASDRLRLGVVTVVPVTSSIARVFPIQVLTGPTWLTGRFKGSSRASAFSDHRNASDLFSGQVMAEVDEALRRRL